VDQQKVFGPYAMLREAQVQEVEEEVEMTVAQMKRKLWQEAQLDPMMGVTHREEVEEDDEMALEKPHKNTTRKHMP
jgi:hypothetical protein